MADKYAERGVAHGKEDVHHAIRRLDKGLYTDTFCKILPDILGGDPTWCNVLHADTAGTKASLAYLYWRETGDLSVWKGIVQDALVMNLDDMAAAGVHTGFVLSSTIGRNKNLVPGEVLTALIEGTVELCEWLTDLGLDIHHAGGETADVGDLVRTLDVGFTVAARLPRTRVQHINIQPGQAIVGIASDGQATYEASYNSGIGSNGLTFARHEVLAHSYAIAYPESFDPNLDSSVVYQGSHRLTDNSPVPGQTIGQLLLSPTRTYLPLVQLLTASGIRPDGIIHCTGGGQTKVLHFARQVRIVKDGLPHPPPVFQLIQAQHNTPLRELYQVFNMGIRLELYLSPNLVSQVLDHAQSLGLQAWEIGRVEQAEQAEVVLTCPTTGETFTYTR